jgi:phospholipase/lecithinase/hemolysin
MMIKKITALFLICFSCMALAGEFKTFEHMTVFGDSLSDNGNMYKYSFHMVPHSPPYYKGRFTNGQVWSELLSKQSFTPSIHLNDYAVGGAGAILSDKEVLPYTLWTELSDYFVKDSLKKINSTLYVVWIGANNYLNAPTNIEGITTSVVKGISSGINRLLKSHAKMIVIGNLPDLGYMPESEKNGTKQVTHDLTVAHNEKLYQLYQRLTQEHPEVTFVYVDIFSLFNKALANPSTFGLSDTNHPCYEGGFFFSAQMRGLMAAMPQASASISTPALKRYFLTKAKLEKQEVSDSTVNAYLSNTVTREAIQNSYYASQKTQSNRFGVINEDSDDKCVGYLFWDHVHPTAHVHTFIAKEFKDAIQQAGLSEK